MRLFTQEFRRVVVVGLVAGSAIAGYPTLSNGQEATPPEAASDSNSSGEIDQARLDAGMQVFKDAGCRACHGWAANGEAEDPNPHGPSLRATLLDYDGLRLTIACGRPTTAMPYFYRNAYRPIGEPECYGATLVQLGPSAPSQGGVRLDDAQLDDLTYYITNYLKGLDDEITFEQCEYFYGQSDRCERYPHEDAAGE